MWLMLQQEDATDYVIATGVAHSVRNLVELSFSHVGLDWRDYVRTDPELVRGTAELHNLVGDAPKARERLGWESTVDFDELVRLLVDEDLRRSREEEEEEEEEEEVSSRAAVRDRRLART